MNPKHLFIAITILFSSFINCFASDLLDNIKDNTKLINDLKDVYRAFNVNHVIYNQNELLNLELDNGNDKPKARLSQYIKICESLKQIHFSNSTLDSYVHKYLSLTIQNYTIAFNHGFHSSIFKIDEKKYKTEYGKYMNYLLNTYPTNYFVNMTEEKYWNILDKSHYIQSKNFASYQKQRKSKVKASVKLLDSIISITTNFQEKTIYNIEKADQYVKYSDTIFSDGRDSAIKEYDAILNQKRYCLYLFETWVKWRAVMQFENGASKSSNIPNDEYNKKRQQVALTILSYITTHPKDEMAINEFLLMATHDIVRRFGDYPYGNQSAIEYHDLFDKK